MRAVIFANGEVPSLQEVRALIKPDDFVVSADGGMRFIRALELTPDLLIGDLDSILPDQIDAAKRNATETIKFPEDKDETDLELAVNEVKTRGFTECLIIGGLGGRIDQTLANIYLIASCRDKNFDIYMDDGCERLNVIIDELKVQGTAGDTVSLIPLFEAIQGITTEGLKYKLMDESLKPDKTRGISNVLEGNSALIKIKKGKLLCVLRRSTCP